MTETRDSINLLQKLTCGDGGNNFPAKHGLPEKVELCLRLSLNGPFGFEPKKMVANDNDNNKSSLSSVIDFNFPVDVELSLNSTISRTYSLPAPESAAEWRKRKEVQYLRRSEAKRKRVEKLKNVKVVKEYQPTISPSPSLSLSSAPLTPVLFSSQGSIGSQGSGGSSWVSDVDSQPLSGTNRDTTECNEINKAQCNSKIKPSVHYAIDQTMPCVSTKEDGPDGKRVQGFLYRYGKGEEVRIVCVCHGSFLTPAEFVKHGGGGDVEHPLRHIVVTNSVFS